MMRITLEIFPQGNESKKFVAGVLEISNDGTGTPGNGVGVGHYDLHLAGPVSDGDGVYMNEFWQRGRLEGFDRTLGYWACVKAALNTMDVNYSKEETK